MQDQARADGRGPWSEDERAAKGRSSPFIRRWRFDGGAALTGLLIAAAGVGLAADSVSAFEEWVFRLVNDLPDALERGMWAGQLLGVLFVPLGLAVLAALWRRWRLALALALLVPAKLFVEYRVIKAVTVRERPATSICGGDLTCLNLRDAPAAGLSVPSGHALVAMGIWWLAAPYLSRRWQAITLAICLLVPVARMYLGAHNPLDVVVGGAAGIAVAAVLNLIVGVPDSRRPTGSAPAEGADSSGEQNEGESPMLAPTAGREAMEGRAVDTNKELVHSAVTALFKDRDLGAIDRYLADDYIQHSSVAGPGVDGLRTLVATAPEGFRYDLARVLAEGDLVALHGVYYGLSPTPLVAFDLFRVADGRLAEHWDALQPEVQQTASGRSMTDGPSEVTQPELTAQNKEFVGQFVDTVLVRGEAASLADYYDGDRYAQHNPMVGDGLSALVGAIKALTEQGQMFRYSKVHRLVADGEFVLVQAEGTIGAEPTAFYDLFRVENGKIAEHWDVVFTIPATLPHDNGLF